MTAALTAPFAVTAVVLCAAGLTKLRSPAGAARAVMVVGLPARSWAVRAFAVGEVALGAWSLVRPAPLAAGSVACLYAGFCLLSLVLARRRASCGCFGDGDAPASLMQSLLSAALAAVAVGAAIAPVHGIGWMLGTAPGQAGVLMIGIAASAYAVVVAYTQLPRAWAAWSAR
jgi:hypothetical protein